jgi:uncharacterized protein YecT (DUF1311 family)
MPPQLLVACCVLLATSAATGAACESPDTSTRYEACMLSESTRKLDVALNATYAEILAEYKQSGRNHERQMFIESQRAWLRCRDKTFEFEQERDGGVNQISRARCTNKLTNERVTYLKALNRS